MWNIGKTRLTAYEYLECMSLGHFQGPVGRRLIGDTGTQQASALEKVQCLIVIHTPLIVRAVSR